MRAIEYDAYGGIDRLVLREVPEPPMPRGGVRVRVACAALNPKDAVVRGGNFRPLSGFRFPKRSGADFAGHVVASGSRRFRVGDRVFGMLEELTCRRGTLADLVGARDREVAALPAGVSFEDGAALALVGLTALQALRDLARVRPGGRVLINGASGGVGTAAIQIARIFGAHVTTVSSRANLELCRELGADAALAYDAGDPFATGGRFDCAFDVFGSLPYRRARPLLRSGGVFVATVPSPAGLVAELAARLTGRGPRIVVVRPVPADLEIIAAWLADRRLRAVVDSRYPLHEIADAFRRLESKRARGKILVRVDDR